MDPHCSENPTLSQCKPDIFGSIIEYIKGNFFVYRTHSELILNILMRYPLETDGFLVHVVHMFLKGTVSRKKCVNQAYGGCIWSQITTADLFSILSN
jgi:hypothetical protein